MNKLLYLFFLASFSLLVGCTHSPTVIDRDEKVFVVSTFADLLQALKVTEPQVDLNKYSYIVSSTPSEYVKYFEKVLTDERFSLKKVKENDAVSFAEKRNFNVSLEFSFTKVDKVNSLANIIVRYPNKILKFSRVYTNRVPSSSVVRLQQRLTTDWKNEVK